MMSSVTDVCVLLQEVCHQYWPRSGFQAFGELTVELMSEEKFEGYVIRTLCLQRAKVGANTKKIGWTVFKNLFYSLGKCIRCTSSKSPTGLRMGNALI